MTEMRRRKGGMDVGGRKKEKRSRSTALKSSADDKNISISSSISKTKRYNRFRA